MARANITHLGGFRPVNAKSSDYVVLDVASAYGTAIYPGDPVVAVSTGYVQRTPAGSAAGAATDGITAVVTEIIQYKDSAGFVRKNAKYLPASITWTAKHERSMLLCVLANENTRFRVTGDTAAASLAAAITTRFNNVDHEFNTADTGLGLSGCNLNMSTVNTTATLQWRVIEWEQIGPGNDATVASYQAIVIPNLIYALPVVGHSTTGV